MIVTAANRLMSLRDLLLGITVVVIFGLNFVVVKIALEDFPPILLLVLRFGLVAVLLGPFLRWPTGRFRDLVAYSIVLGLLHFSVMYVSLSVMDASLAAILIQTQVPMTALLAAVFLKEGFGWRRGLGLAIASIGVVILVGGPVHDSPWWAIVGVLIGAGLYAIATLQMKAFSDMPPTQLNGWLAVLTTPQLLTLSLVIEQAHWSALTTASVTGWAAILWQSVVIVIFCFGIWYRLLSRNGVNDVMPLTLLVPLVGVIGGVTVLGEAMTIELILGGLVTVVGVAIMQIRWRPPKPSVPA